MWQSMTDEELEQMLNDLYQEEVEAGRIMDSQDMAKENQVKE